MCRRTNGQGWWCKNAAAPGTTFCQNHLERIRKQRENRAARDSLGGGSKEGSLGLESFAAQGGGGDSDEDKPLWELPGLRSAAPSLLQAAEGGDDGEEKAMQDKRCKRRDGRNWQCSKERLLGRPYCKEHTERDRKKREQAKRNEKEKKRRKKEQEELAQAQQADDVIQQEAAADLHRQAATDVLMSAAEVVYPEQLIRFAPAGLQAAGMPLTNRSAFTPVASHGSAFTPVASHSFGGHAFLPVNRLNQKKPAQQIGLQSSFGLYSESKFGVGALRDEMAYHLTPAQGGAFQEESVHDLYHPTPVQAGAFREESINDLYHLTSVQEVPMRACQRRDGKGWTCPFQAVEGRVFCEKHCDRKRKKARVLQEEEFEQQVQVMAEQQERGRRAYEDQEILMQGFDMPSMLYNGDAPRFGSILSI
jgi:hypothetical protein